MSEHEEQKQNIEPAATEHAATAQEPATQPRESRNFVWLAVISIALTIIAWIAGNYNGVVAMAVSAAAIVAGALALKSHRNSVRNTAITSIIAAAVLLIVIAAFLIVIYLGIKSI